MVNNEILTAINQAVQNFDLKQIDDYLDMRDEELFDENWVTAFKTIITWIDKNDITFKTEEETLRESVFKSIVKLTHNYELAGYLSDDAGLIFANQYFNVNNDFANQLFSTYQNKILPH